jgi:hypothetical protein
LFHRAIQISGDPAFDHHALCLEVHFVGFCFNKIVLGPPPRWASRRLAVRISRPMFLHGLPLVRRGYGTNAAHCSTIAS